LLIIKPKQSNKFYISARRGAFLFLSLITVISISFAGNGFAQNLSGGDGGSFFMGVLLAV